MNKIGEQLIVKLARRNCYAHKLINFSDLLRLVPMHLRGEAKEEIDELYRQGFLNKRPGVQKEFRYSLCIEKKREIEQILSNYYQNNDTLNV